MTSSLASTVPSASHQHTGASVTYASRLASRYARPLLPPVSHLVRIGQRVDRLRPLGLRVEPGVVELEENPLGPAKVVRIGRGQFAAPVVTEAQRLDLALEGRDVRLGGLARMLAGPDRVLLRRQPERVPAHRMQHVEPPGPTVPRQDVGGRVPLRMPDVQPRPGGVGKQAGRGEPVCRFSSDFNFDPRRQLHGLTLYNKTMAPDAGVLLVYADVDPARLVTLAKAAKDYQSTPYKQYVIHNWIDEKKNAKNGVQPRTYAATFGAQAVVFGQKEEAVASALNVLDGAAAAMSSTSLWPFGTDNGSGYLQAVAQKISLPDSDPNAAIFRLAKLLQLKLGEDRGQMLGTLTMVTESEGVASSVAGIAKGLIALMKLQTSKPVNVKLAEALALEQQGGNVMMNLSMPSTQVVELMKLGAAEKAAKKAESN